MIDDIPEPSMDDKRLLEFITDFVFFENGNYAIILPFKSESVAMSNNWKEAEHKLY